VFEVISPGTSMNKAGITMNLHNTYPTHITEKQKRAKEILERTEMSSIVIHSGKLVYMFQDDMTYPFKCNPLFKAWLPVIDNPNSWLIVDGVSKPKLVFYQPVDFWHSVPEDPKEFWTDQFEILKLTSLEDINKFLPADKSKSIYLGQFTDDAKELGFTDINNKTALDYLHYHRAYKTDYEMDCIREANRIAVGGHQAAKAAFMSGASEFEIQLEYFRTVAQSQNEVPYGTIIGLNQNGSILHYTTLERKSPLNRHSMLIDAGANCNGYASDITRSYSFEKDEFADLITAMDKVELDLCNSYKVGESYADAHLRSFELIAGVLSDFKFIDLPAEDIVAKGLVKPFYPHGLGHHLGLQVHDLGANLADDHGTAAEKPKDHPHLRATRILEPRMVYTCEPGLYFIDTLLQEVKASENSKYMNWSKIESFKKYGGIRIEDNIILHAGGNENITRDLGL
jgi:Xaa-Pro dipeptidase